MTSTDDPQETQIARQRKRLRLMRELAICSDQFYADAQQLGAAAAEALTRRRRAQLTGLETLANSSLSVGDILDYIKVRTARSNPGADWQANIRHHLDQRLAHPRRQEEAASRQPILLGAEIMGMIERDLRTYRDQVCKRMGLRSDGVEAQQIHLALIRAFARQLSVQFEYCSGEKAGDDGAEADN